jgi:hypothetical protein
VNGATAAVPAAVVYCLAGTGAAFSLLLFVLLHLHFRALERCVFEQQRAAEGAMEALRQASAQMAQDLDGLMTVAGPAPDAPIPMVPARSGLNLSRRAQALRMHKRGESAEEIAHALGVPRQEVDLLLKVHRILIASVG